MPPLDFVPVGALVLAAVIGATLARRLPEHTTQIPRDGALQGFRGLLALGVFLHHAFVMNHFVHGYGWRDHTMFAQFGESRVVLFFMLTSTLFYGRLVDARGGKLDWLRLYVSRLLRLGPAYWFAILLMFGVVGIAACFHIDGAGTAIAFRAWSDIISSFLVWMTFCMLGLPAVDGYLNASLVTAGVTWTLPYECTFYMLLPLLALPLRIGMRPAALVLGLAAAIWAAAWMPEPMICLPFVGGMAVALLVRLERVVKLLRTPACAVAAIVSMVAAVACFPSMFAPWPQLLLGFSMAVVSSDNDLFGILRWRLPQALGKWAYSLYMLHGIVLYVAFMFLIGADRASQLTNLQYGLIIVVLTPVVLGLSWASQRWIESPPMRAVPAVVAAIRKRLPQRAAAVVVPAASSAVVPPEHRVA